MIRDKLFPTYLLFACNANFEMIRRVCVCVCVKSIVHYIFANETTRKKTKQFSYKQY